MAKDDTKEVLGIMDDAIKSTGIIMLITGAGGSLGNVIKVSGIGDALGEAVMALPLPAILIPFIIAALMRIALGSGGHHHSGISFRFPDGRDRGKPSADGDLLLCRRDFLLLLQ